MNFSLVLGMYLISALNHLLKKKVLNVSRQNENMKLWDYHPLRFTSIHFFKKLVIMQGDVVVL
jgi:hypothetical protein